MENIDTKAEDISVIITTRGRINLVDKLLESLVEAGKKFPAKYETFIIDDSNPEDAEALKIVCQKYQATYVAGPTKVTQKRNLGGNLSHNPILLFLDSDCQATPDLFVEHEKCFHTKEIGAVLGLLKFVGPDTWIWKGIELTPYVMPFDFPLYMKYAPWGPTANFSVRRELFLRINGFDETFPQKPGGEDVDLGLRLTKTKQLIFCNSSAIVYHSKDTWVPIRQIVSRFFQWGAAECYLMDKHPENIVNTLPRFTLVAAISFLATIFFTALTRNYFSLLIFPVWILVQLNFQTLFQILWAKRPIQRFFHQLFALVITIINEMGLVKEIFRQKKFRFWVQQMIYTPGQMEGEWYYGGSKIWSTFLSFIVVFGLALCIIN